jgi:hypothetical protein
MSSMLGDVGRTRTCMPCTQDVWRRARLYYVGRARVDGLCVGVKLTGPLIQYFSAHREKIGVSASGLSLYVCTCTAYCVGTVYTCAQVYDSTHRAYACIE